MAKKKPSNGRTSKPRAARSPPRKASKRALKTYRGKRDFSKTAEPSGDEILAAVGSAFVVQKHAASHLHYDFRLEMDGVLKSWAVAKGPSVDPAVKRLAVETEDHPLAYGDFEGTIPKGEYGGGTVMLWDWGTWQPVGDMRAAYKAGRLKFRLNGDKMRGLWALVRMKARARERTTNWLLIKDKDAYAQPGAPDALLAEDCSVKTGRDMSDIAAGNDVWVSNQPKKAQRASTRSVEKKAGAKRRSALPAFIEPQLATRVDDAPGGDGWLHEIKFDGYRLHARVAAGQARLLTRRGADWSKKFGTLPSQIAQLSVAEAYLDGEVIVLDSTGLSDFAALQAWFKTGQGRLVYYAFDVLFLNGKDLRSRPLLERKEVLRNLIASANTPNIIFSDHQIGAGPAFFTAAAGMKIEGIISKQADAPYTSGRGRSWLKIKRIARQEFVIGGFTRSAVSPRAIGALLMGEYTGRKLTYVGKVGTGYTTETARDLFAQLSRIKRDTTPFQAVPSEVRKTAVWVAPKLVAEVEFSAWTSDHILRHAAFLGLREDKPATDIRPEKILPVKKIVKQIAPAKSGEATAQSAPDVLGVAISHPERVIYADEDISKYQVARYYADVAHIMLPYVTDRPLALVRCPDGVGPACFFQKHAGAGLPPAIREETVSRKKGDTVLLIDSAEGLVSLVQRGVLEVHTWGSRFQAIETPDMAVFDFDPDERVKWPRVVKAAMDMRAFLEGLGLASFVKTTGGKGLHVVVPFRPLLEWDAIKEFTRTVAVKFAATDPQSLLVNMSKKQRAGRIFIDYLRNGRGATAVAPYSTRARPGALVATPLSWDELEAGAQPRDFPMAKVLHRIGERFKDPWTKMLKTRQQITQKAVAKLLAL
jgi:bifunctional non-homologous end joining protein LigD